MRTKRKQSWWRIFQGKAGTSLGSTMQIATAALLMVFLLALPLEAANSWFSKVRESDPGAQKGMQLFAAGDSDKAVFDIVVSLYNDPPDTNDEATYEEIIEYFADGVYEQSNGAHKLGKVRIFTNGGQSSRADIVWNEREWPRAHLVGFGANGRRITFGDIFPDGCGDGCDYDMLNDAEGAGYTLAHEWGHYVYGLYDEYRGRTAGGHISSPRSGDTPVTPSIMNRQWAARGDNFEWLNHSTEDNYEANTAQGRVYGASGWEVLVRERSEDPRSGSRSALPKRTHYTQLDDVAPDADDDWIIENLPDEADDARDELEIIWMEDDIEIQLAIDRSGSMSGSPLVNAKLASQTLVDVVDEGSTALGVVTFDTGVNQLQPIIPIPDPATKTQIKNVIGGITLGSLTAMFDGAGLALNNLIDYQATNNTSASQIVFLLSDGGDNNSNTWNESSIISAYLNNDVPLITFGYGSGAPGGVLRRLADGTGGEFFSSPTTLTEIQQAFLSAATAVTSSVSPLSETAVLPSSGTFSKSFQVDSTLASFIVIVSHGGDPADVDFNLISPSGPSSVVFTCSGTGSGTTCTASVDPATLLTEGGGEWSIEADNQTTTQRNLTANIIAAPAATRSYDVTVDFVGGTEVHYPEPILITAAVSKGLPITGVNLTALVTDPNGNTSAIDMNDEGRDGDGEAGDGIYSAIIGYSAGGTYTVRVRVDNDNLAAEFTTDGFQPAHPAPNTDGGMPPAPPLPDITENFMRTATAQVTVEGVVGDDHPDNPTGTEIQADNTDVPGAIDFAGDVDFFEIVGIDTSEDLVVRVTDVALGMSPRLTVFTPDGVTEIDSAALAGAGEYVSIVIPAADLDPSGKMAASVEHTDPSADQGTYMISAGSFLVSDGIPATVDVNAGWNLISLPVQPADKHIVAVLNDLDGKYDSVWAYDAGVWTAYFPGTPGLSTMNEMETGIGYWINMNQAASFTVKGSRPDPSIDLGPGWNLVGYNAANAIGIENALASIDRKYISVWGYEDGSWLFYSPNPNVSSTLDQMGPGFGYWINATEGVSWTLP